MSLKKYYIKIKLMIQLQPLENIFFWIDFYLFIIGINLKFGKWSQIF